MLPRRTTDDARTIADATFERACACLASVRDIVEERANGQAPPRWCEARGWTEFLRALPDDAVTVLERDGLGAQVELMADAPASLVALAREIGRATTLPRATDASAHGVAKRRASPRKRTQVASFARLIEGLAPHASRVVDLGSGHGHLTRHLAQELGLVAEGWERDAARARVASSLVSDGSTRFVVAEARDLQGAITSADLVVGLHACGELADEAVKGAVAARASVAIVACCPQKRAGGRAPLSSTNGAPARDLTLPHAALGLANVRDGDTRVETHWADCVDSRVRRIALRRALLSAGHPVAPGEEMRGINRRRASGPLLDLVTRAFVMRGLPDPSPALVFESEREAREEHRLARRWELPRTMLARLVEVWIALDRAAFLRQSGYLADVSELFGAEVSPRNVAVVGRPA